MIPKKRQRLRKTIRAVTARSMYEIVMEEWRANSSTLKTKAEIAKRHNLCYGTVCSWISGRSRPHKESMKPHKEVKHRPLISAPKRTNVLPFPEAHFAAKIDRLEKEIEQHKREYLALQKKLTDIQAAFQLLQEAMQ